MPISPSRTAARPARLDARQWAVISLLCAAFIVAYFDRQNFSIALSDRAFTRFFHLSDNSRGFLNSAFFWSYAAFQIPAGWAVDRYGVKRPFAIGFALWSLLAGCIAWAGSAGQLFVFRFLLGAGEAINTPAGMRWISLNIDSKKHGFVMGLYQASAKIGPAIGAPLTAGLMLAFGWRAMFMLIGFGALLWLVPWMLLVKDDFGEAAVNPSRVAKSPPLPFSLLLRNRVLW